MRGSKLHRQGRCRTTTDRPFLHHLVAYLSRPSPYHAMGAPMPFPTELEPHDGGVNRAHRRGGTRIRETGCEISRMKSPKPGCVEALARKCRNMPSLTSQQLLVQAAETSISPEPAAGLSPRGISLEATNRANLLGIRNIRRQNHAIWQIQRGAALATCFIRRPARMKAR